MRRDVLVVGGGPTGCLAAAAMAAELEVTVVEEHPRIGEPVQCAGLVTPRVVEMASAPDAVLNRIDGAYVHFPGGRTLELQGNEVKAVVVDRGALDRRCASLAERAGAEVWTGAKCGAVERTGDGIRACFDGEDMECRALLAADGYRSGTARALGLGPTREMVRGVEMDLDVRAEDQRKVRVFLGRAVAPGFFAWAIPCGAMIRVGLCVSEGNGPPSAYLRPLLATLGLSEAERVRAYSGAIPLGHIARTYADRALVAGDAAGMAKPISGGGLFTGMTAGRLAAETFLEAFRGNDLTARTLSSYEGRWKAAFGSELRNSYLVRRAFVRMSDRELDRVGAQLDTERAKEVLATGDIDFPTALAPGLLRACPSLMALAPGLLLRLLRR
ncbi:MAG TPA: NAD(P)/FAD-dependent oxidoreductase [Methanomassiliicoccales archaeon]|nr:NAD(P)/FAD-dependent oxidoreductase [Methanomassiliicoccales archaeon]HRU10923.1 NAD(P)/FAD-dependent oxidoreductase [Methanomassiliicoccales archaeon]